MSILIVDNSKVVQAYFMNLLSDAGYRDIIQAETAVEALTILGYDSPDWQDPGVELILMDVLVPGLDGLDACRLLHNDKRFSSIPVIIITSVEALDNMYVAFDAGAVDYITKPPNRVELVSKIRSALRLKEGMDRLKQREKELMLLTEQLEEANRKLERLATHDTLTGIANRRFLNQFLHNEWRHAIRQQDPITIIMIDIDCFKAFNDTYGHLAGDDCLVAVGTSLNQMVKRPKDLVARFGGEEFIVVLPGTANQGAFRLAEKMRSAVASLGIRHEASTAADIITVSLGVATTRPVSASAPESLVDKADKALYIAKANGRNQTCVAET